MFLPIWKRAKFLVWREVGVVLLLFLASCVSIRGRKSARTMKIAVYVHMLAVKFHDCLRILFGNVGVAHVLPYPRRILALHQCVVIRPSRARFCLFNGELGKQSRHYLVYVFATVVGVESLDAKRKRSEEFIEERTQKFLADALHAPDYFPLSHFIHEVNVVHGFFLVQVPLMYRVNP